LRVTASDLDPAMVARARANIDRVFRLGDPARPGCTEADVAALPFPPVSFDVVVSTFSMHHWADPAAGLAELHRVLRPGGRVLVWDFAGRIRRLEGRTPDPAAAAAVSPFGTATVHGWPWPGPLRMCERVELRRAIALATGESA
ncbi:MAG TPA: class I SAM-dependent methyltransferase, partial [Candidatus Acidoferrales bacterium]|nr:class I SAM-dependent methyltransferase [Candidatus Acidoferrales bacterium]